LILSRWLDCLVIGHYDQKLRYYLEHLILINSNSRQLNVQFIVFLFISVDGVVKSRNFDMIMHTTLQIYCDSLGAAY
jgi:hypothetical protein